MWGIGVRYSFFVIKQTHLFCLYKIKTQNLKKSPSWSNLLQFEKSRKLTTVVPLQVKVECFYRGRL